MCLMICSKILSYFPTSTYDLNPKPNSDLPIIPIRRHRVSPVTATARNPNQFGLTDGISVSPRWAYKHSVTYCNILGPTEICNRSHRDCNINSVFPFCNFSVSPKEQIGRTEFAWPTLWLANYQIRSHRVCVIGLTEITLCPNPNRIGPTELHVSPTENL